jgi:tetratricopeptide (TPR) repeat protein
LPVPASRYPQADSLTRFARALGMARSGDVANAKQEIEAIKALRDALAQASQSYWADRSEEQMLAATAWVALAEGDGERAMKFMRAAADGEDASVKHVAMENRLYPMRELLGDLLLELGQPAAALKEYETALKDNPNRYRGFWGAARAADAAGDRPKATGYFTKLVELSRNADTERQEIREAKASLKEMNR